MWPFMYSILGNTASLKLPGTFCRKPGKYLWIREIVTPKTETGLTGWRRSFIAPEIYKRNDDSIKFRTVHQITEMPCVWPYFKHVASLLIISL